ncbi:hypothetical protein P0Y43_12835 [Pseudomonas entomophila]|uniref:hypothetical protein n=1 Tax=Pseudomonas entomophila TaxID=312306 RepID=UPI0023D7F3D4|nr:hypothetical protein [Pseudomonas entomophila]MDF0731603.1 hypothetical protein [Pseudomonas entomophila]
MTSRLERLKVVFAPETITGEAVLDRVVEILARLTPAPKILLQGRPVQVAALKKQIAKKRAWPSGMACNDLDLRFGIVFGLHDFLLVEEQRVGAAGSWDLWVEALMQLPGFVQAWVVDTEYDYWQNAKDVLEYDAVGRDHSGLAKLSNGLPFPLEQLEIDISGNPGRWALREGYVEAVAARMWLGERFWARGGDEHKANVMQAPGVTTQVLEGGVLKLVAAPQNFVDVSTARTQNALRALLYP